MVVLRSETRRKGSEFAAEVVEVTVRQRFVEQLLDDVLKVVQGLDSWQGFGVEGSECSSGDGEQHCRADDRERYLSMIESVGEASVSGSHAARGSGRISVEFEDPLNVAMLGGGFHFMPD